MFQKVFTSSWKKTKNLNKPSDGNYKVARPLQDKGFRLLDNVLHAIINAPTGSGKSLLMMMLAASELRDDNRVVIISVPQSNIANGFIEEKFKLGRKKIHWFTNHLLCGTNGTIDRFVDLLCNPRDIGMEDRVIVCTHMTLVLAYKKLASMKKLSVLKKTSLYLDEAHHSMAHDEEEDEGQSASKVANGIGKIVKHYLKNDLGLLMVTATFFRGDRSGLIPNNYRDKFARFEVPFDEYVAYTNIENFSFDFLFYEGDYIKAFSEIYDPKKKTILYIPATGTSCSIKDIDKYKEVDEILKSISDNGMYNVAEDGSISLTSNGRKICAVDLVDEIGRDRRQKFIYNNRNTGKIDLIIAMRTFQEGSDYPPLERIMVAGPRDSIGQVAQIIGRGFRDYGSKKKVEYVQLFPKIKKEVKESLNDYLNMIYCSMLLEEIIDPVAPQFIKSKKHEKNGKEKHNYLTEQFPDFDKRANFIGEIMNKAIQVGDNLNFDTFVDIVDKQKELKKCNNKKEIAMRIWMMMVRRTIGQAKFNKLDFESIKHQDAVGFMVRYASGTCDINTFKELRSYLGQFLSLDELKKEVREAGIKLKTQYEKEYKKHDGWPSNPNRRYENKGWISWNDLFGKAALLSLDELKKEVREAGIKTSQQYYREYKKHDGWPSNPCQYYEDRGWISWNDLFGKAALLSLDELKKEVREAGIKTSRQYYRECKKHDGWPGNPNRRYENKGWINWNDLFGTRKKMLLSLDELKKEVREAGIKLKTQYEKEYKKHDGWPSAPYRYYTNKGWNGWDDLFGKILRNAA